MKKIKDYDINENYGIEYEIQDIVRKRKNNLQQRKSRIKKVINKIRDGDLYKYFVTLTYTDSALKNNKKQLVKNLKNFIYQNFDTYMFNDDYGSENGRYHHHGIGTSWLSIDELNAKWKYGWVEVDEVQFDVKNYIKVSNYVKKLSNHAQKDNTSVLRIGDNSDRNIVSYALDFDVPVVIED